MYFLYILLAILAFGLLIFIHELGHYITARIFHVTVYEFAIGMGPRLAWFQSKKTGIVYALRMIPFGGFVSMAGELSDEEEPTDPTAPKSEEERLREERIAADPRLGTLASKAAWKRLIVHAAGAVMNLVLGFVIVTVTVMAVPNLYGTTVDSFVTLESGEAVPTQKAGLMVGDTITHVNGSRVQISDRLNYLLQWEGGEEPVVLTVRRGEETLDITVSLATYTSQGQKLGAPDFYPQVEKKNPVVVVKHAFFKTTNMAGMVWDSLIALITGQVSFGAVSGPVGVTTVIADSTKQYFPNFFALISFISINLGIFNLLPLPALDGGHVFYTFIELVTRRRLPARVIGIIDAVGLVILFGFMIVVTGKDIIGLF